MTQDQAENRAERIAIMTVEGMSEEEAHRYCDTKPEQYGTREATQ
jgi:hypothetical protein